MKGDDRMSLLSECSNEQFISIVENSYSIAECEKKIGYNSYSGSVASLIRGRIQELGLSISHFTKVAGQIRTPDNIFVENSTASQRTLRKYYLIGNYTPYICDICGQPPFWNNQTLTLILDHKNGINTDDRLENLHWVCPNCNQQLPTTGSKNTAYKKEIVKNLCIDCGIEISKGSDRCRTCNGKHRENNVVSRETLKHLIRTVPFTEIGRMYGVSDNAIRKWCDKYNLPKKVSEIKTYSNEQWLEI